METKCKRCGVNNEYPSFHHCVVSEPTPRDWSKEIAVQPGDTSIKGQTVEEYRAALLEFIESKKKLTKTQITDADGSIAEACDKRDIPYLVFRWNHQLTDHFNEGLDFIASHIRHDL